MAQTPSQQPGGDPPKPTQDEKQQYEIVLRWMKTLRVGIYVLEVLNIGTTIIGLMRLLSQGYKKLPGEDDTLIFALLLVTSLAFALLLIFLEYAPYVARWLKLPQSPVWYFVSFIAFIPDIYTAMIALGLPTDPGEWKSALQVIPIFLISLIIRLNEVFMMSIERLTKRLEDLLKM